MIDFRITLTHDIYAPRCIEVAADEYRAYLMVRAVQQNEHETALAISGQGGGPAEEQAVRDFLNRLLDLSVLAALEGA